VPLRRRSVPILIAAALVAAAALAFVLLRGGDSREARATACPQGYTRLSEEYLRELKAGTRDEPGGGEESEEEREREREREGGAAGRTLCLRSDTRKPEPFADLARINTASVLRLGADRPGSLAAAVRAKQRIAQTSIPGTAGRWTPIGSGPLRGDDPQYPSGSGTGFVKLAGRITDYAYDPATKDLFAAVSSGGMWRSTDTGQHWTSIGDTLPTQTMGAVAWTRAGGGTLIALTGDNAFGGNTYAGAGAYWSDDTGGTWHKSKGIPDGAMGFRLAVRADDPNTVYAATGVGLFRSTDAGRSFEDVLLPTGDCAGKSFTRGCFLANVVTDVVVQSADKFGHSGGAVLAVVGWRAGARKNLDGTVQAPANGLYSSPNGARGSFKRLPGTGFTPQNRIGRVSLGIADGPDQNHAYVYAMVQDSVLFNSGKLEGLDIGDVPDPLDLGLDLTATPTYLNGVYVTSNFGQSWTRMALGEQFLLPTNLSSLAPLSVLGFGPGIQAWYNSIILPDPATQSGGVPTRVVLGLEEVFETRTVGLPQNGPTDFVAVGPYNATGGACLLVLAGDICSQKQAATPGQTTTHPDQHGMLFVPGPDGRSILLVGNDGGNYVQRVPASGNLTPSGFGPGANEGFNTLLPYGVARAKDGVTYAGLQDNGQIKITPDGRQVMTYGGDGTFTLVDPDDSNAVLEATPNAGLNRSTDGGKTWTAVAPVELRNAQFLAPMVMDPTDKKRLAVGGRNIFVADTGIAGITSENWAPAYDLGTQKNPGNAGAVPNQDDPANTANALDIRGKTVYVGYCGSCDPVKDNQRFRSGIATNEGGTWRIAAAKGLPQRVISSVAIDPDDLRTVYVALGSSTVRPYAPSQALGDDGTDPAGGHVYKSTDAGETFTDISGDLPSIGATWVLVKGSQLLAATTVGVFASRTRAGKEWGLLGPDLPAAPVFSMTFDPANANRLIAASLGRGVYSYEFADPRCLRPSVRVAKSARRNRRLRLSGTTRARGCGAVKRVAVSVAKLKGKRCRYLQPNGRVARRATSCSRRRYVRAKGTRRWSFTAKRRLPAGSYSVVVKAADAAGKAGRRTVRIRLR
jgi:hypothetical protein